MATGLTSESQCSAFCRLMSEYTFTRLAQTLKKEAGLSTCSTTSMEQTTSKRFGSARRDSAGTCLYVRPSGLRRGSAAE